MIVDGALSYQVYLWLAAISLLSGLGLVVLVWGRRDRLHSRSGAKTLIRELAPVLVCFVFVVISCAFVWAAYDQRLAHAPAHSASILGEFLAAFIEDIVFFFTIGLVVFVVQRRQHERSRSLEDRVDLLFDARRLTNREIDELKKRVRTVGCDYHLNECVIDIIEYDAENDCALLDVTRRYEARSFLRNEEVDFEWTLRLEPDPVPGKTPLLKIFPITTQEYHLRKRLWRRPARVPSGHVETLHEGRTMDVPEFFEWSPDGLRVSRGTIREIQFRYCGWQPLRDAATGEPKMWAFNALKHWHRCALRVRNKLAVPVMTYYSGFIRRECEIAPGQEDARNLPIIDMPLGSKICIQFEPK